MIAVIGAGAFGSALAMAIPGDVRLWGRGLTPGSRRSPRLPDHEFPENVTVAGTLTEAVEVADAILLAVPMKALAGMLGELPPGTAPIIACCKGIDPATGQGPATLIAAQRPEPSGILTGPSFAADIARGLPTALTLAMADDAAAQDVQARVSGPCLRLYRTTDVKGAELGGALKNVLAIAAGAVAGADLGQSAQAALLTRGFAEIVTLAEREGAQADTLMGLSGIGDLMLTALSEGSRNYRYGRSLGLGEAFQEDTTVEGVATARAVAALAEKRALDLPVLGTTHRVIAGEIDIAHAVAALMSRPLKEE